MRTIILAVLLQLFVMATMSIAKEIRWYDEGGFKSAPASELLSVPEYKTYQKLISEKDCGPAALLLNKAFVKRYPQMSDAAAPRGAKFMRWFVHFVSLKFPDLDFCLDSLKLKHVEMYLAQDGTKIGKYFRGDLRKPPLLYWKEWQDRDHFVGSIVLRAAKDHPPALLEIAKLVKRGDVFDLKSDFEFYLIKRACHLNYPCEAYTTRLNELENAISPDIAKQMTLLASSENIVLKKLGRIK